MPVTRIKPPCYKVETWDHENDRWRSYVTRTRKWGLREVLRTLYGYGWTRITVYVSRREAKEAERART